TSAETNDSDSPKTERRAARWHDSVWFDLAIALVAGFFYALLAMGPRPLNPRNVNWIAFDPAYHYIGWGLFRQDPHVHWPLTYTDRLGYPEGESVALLDLNPLLAVVLKPLSPLLPEPAQYFGIEVILACTLQFFFAFRLLRLMTEGAGVRSEVGDQSPQGLKPNHSNASTVPSAEADSAEEISGLDAGLKASSTLKAGGGRPFQQAVKPCPDTKRMPSNVLGAALCSVFFLLVPPLNYRFWGHYSLSNQWLLVAALFVFAQAQQPSPRSIRRFVIWACVLAAVSVGTNPYLAFEVLLLLTAAVVSLLWQKRISVAKSAGIVGLLAAISFVMAYSLGLVISGGKGYSSGGYRDLSMNLLAPVDPRTWTSIIFPRLPGASAGQYEGYNYLGAGVLILAVIVVVAAIIRRGKVWRPDKRWLVPLGLCCLLLTLLALSTKVTLGSTTVIDLDPSGKLSPYFAPLRASGRLFWAPYYAILAAILAAPFLLFRKAWANSLIAAMLVLQFADTSALRRWVHTTISEEHPSPLKSPIWSQLGSQHQNLIVLPAWQCEKNASPGGPEGYRIFGFLAVQQKMRTNSYQSARYTGVAQDFHCSQSIAELSQQPLSPDSAYVVMPDVAAAIAQGPSGPGKCHDLDHFILCSAKTDFGLSPVLMTPEERVENSVANPGFEDGNTAPWSTNGVKASVSTAQAHSGSYSLAETGAGTVYQDINGLEPGATYTLSAWVLAPASSRAGTTAQLIIYNPSDNVAASSPAVACNPSWRLLSRSFTVGREGAIRIHLARGPGDSTVYWDDVHLARGSARDAAKLEAR
ncbi:MAG: DUF6311 domain-containing protein, partial [Candidatus Korobacteraceae bacterium]